MTQHTILDNENHRNLRILDAPSDRLGDGVMTALIVPDEFRQVQAEYPILFQRDANENFVAVALLGFESGENLYLTDDSWNARYKPLSHAIQPFLIGQSNEGEQDAKVHVDMGHARISSSPDVGVRVFDDSGSPTPYLERIAEQLGALHVGYLGSKAFFAALKKFDLLEPFTLEVPLTDGSKNSLVGFHILNEERLRRLDSAEFGELQQEGHLMPIYMALASLSQLSGLIGRKEAGRSRG